MTIAVNDRLSSYTGDGTETSFAYDFPITASTELEVVTVTSGVSATKTLTTDYTVTISGDGTGTVTFLSAPASGVKVHIAGKTPLQQPADYINVDAFPAASHEGSMDRNTKGNQEIGRDVARAAALLPYGETAAILKAAAQRAGYVAGFDASTGAFGQTSLNISLLADLLATFSTAQYEIISQVAEAIESGTLEELSGLTPAANRVPYFDGASEAALLSFLDEDDMASDSATGLPSQQSVNYNLVRRALVGTYAEMRALSVARATAHKGFIVTDRGPTLLWAFSASDLSSEVSGDEVTASEGDGGLYVAPTADKTGASGAWRPVGIDVVTPELYGAAGDGVTDDTDAFAAAVASGYDVECSGSYLLGAGSVVSTTSTQSVYGSRKSTENGTGTTAKIVFTATTGTIIEFQEAFCQIHHLSFTGPSKTTSATAVKAARQSNTDDMEFTVHTVYFETCQIALDVTGRGLNVSDVETASVGTLIKRSWPTSGTEGTGFQALPWGWRKDQISRVRPHSSTILLDNSHDANRDDYQVVMTDIYMDVGSGTVFRGQCKNSIFDHIKSHHAVASPFDFTDKIADTSFSNINISGTPSDSSTTPGNGIRFGDDVDRCTFTGINLSYLDSFGILIEGDMLYSTLSGFTINNIGTDGTGTNACLRVVGAITDCAISGGVMESGSGNYHISVDGTVSDSRIVGISYDYANEDLMAGSWTDGGGNIIEDKNTRNVDSYISGVYRFSVADDSVHTLTPPKNGGMFTVSCMTGPYGPASALVFYDLGGSVNIDLNTGWAGTTSDNVTVSNSTVAGTTGTDAFLNIGTDGTDLQFENRVGNTAVYEVRFL